MAYLYFSCVATPVFSLSPDKVTEAVEGTSASLSCRAVGYPTPAMTWFKDGTRLPSEERHVILTTGSLRILQVQARDEGVYTCQAINVIGVRTARSRLVVKPEGEYWIIFRGKGLWQKTSLRSTIEYCSIARSLSNCRSR